MPILDITKESVAEAVEKIRGQGKTPSVRAVRDALGGGSFAKIQPLVKAVLEENPEVPQVVPERLKAFIKAASEYTTPIDEETNKKIADEIKRLKDDSDQSARELRDAEALVEALKKEKEELQKRLDSSQASERVLEERAWAAEKAREDAKEELLKISFDQKEYEALKERQETLEVRTAEFQENVLKALAEITAKLETAPKKVAPKKTPEKKAPAGKNS